MREAFQKIIDPRPRELWLLYDNKIMMDEENRQLKGTRLCLVLFNPAINGKNYRHIVPCSASASTDRMHFPLSNNVDEIDSYNYKDSSHACLHLYQPLRIDAFHRRVGIVNQHHYLLIRNAISQEVLGIPPLYDISP